MDIYLIDESKNYTLQFPVTPTDSFSKTKEKKYTTADIIDFGEVDISDKGSKIREISFNSFFPLEYDASYCTYVMTMTPQDFISLIESWIDSDVQVRLIITDLNINELVNISKFTPQIKAGEVGDIYFSITFRTYRELKVETVNNASNENLGGLEDNRSTQSFNFAAEDTVTVTAKSLNVRDGPGTENNILGSVSKGDKLKLYGVQDNWADTYFGIAGGWISLDYVTK